MLLKKAGLGQSAQAVPSALMFVVLCLQICVVEQQKEGEPLRQYGQQGDRNDVRLTAHTSTHK
jgi:hypothetical protein